MRCEYVKVGDITAIVCSSGARRRSAKCVKCGRLAMRQCDWKCGANADGTRATCDAFICSQCSTVPEKGKDLCPAHAEAWAVHPSNPANRANNEKQQNSVD